MGLVVSACVYEHLCNPWVFNKGHYLPGNFGRVIFKGVLISVENGTQQKPVLPGIITELLGEIVEGELAEFWNLN